MAEQRLEIFDSLEKHIEIRRIDLLDDAVCDFVIDHVHNIDGDGAYVVAMMDLYNKVTNCRT